MAKFSYIVKDQQGKSFKNIIDANSSAEVVSKLQSQGYFIVSIKELSGYAKPKQSGPITRKRKFTHKKVKLDDLLSFSNQLATMLESGITLIRSIDVILMQVQSEEFSKILTKIKHDLEQGGALSVALSKYPKTFNQFWVSLIEVGEASGTIPVVLNKLAFYLEQQAAFRATIASGLIYPAILFTVSMGAVVFFAVFVGPRFEAIFKQMNVSLPLITIILLAIFKFMKNYFFVMLGGIILLIFFLKNYFKTYTGRIVLEKILFSLPTAGDVYRLIIIERFTSQMSILIDAGVPILYALDISERLVNNNTCAIIINNVKESVKKGELLVQSMDRSGFFPPMCIQMIMVGEETGKLSKMLKHVAKFYQEQVETFMKRFSTIIEPFMLIFMGAIIGTIVVSMFLPMFNIAQLGGAGGG